MPAMIAGIAVRSHVSDDPGFAQAGAKLASPPEPASSRPAWKPVRSWHDAYRCHSTYDTLLSWGWGC